METCNLHTHSSRSDGRHSIAELVRLADEAGIRALSVTDHDVLSPPDLKDYEAAADGRVELIPGAEVSATYQLSEDRIITVHIVALLWQESHADALRDVCAFNRGLSNRVYIEKILGKLSDCGMSIGSYEELEKRCSRRPEKADVALELSRQKDISVEQAYNQFISSRGRAYVPNHGLIPYASISLVVDAIIASRGVPVLAHPLLYHLTNKELEELFAAFKEAVGDNVAATESYYRNCTPLQQQYIHELNVHFGLLDSCGSDFHGNSEVDRMKGYNYSIVERLRAAHEKQFSILSAPSASKMFDWLREIGSDGIYFGAAKTNKS